MMGAVETGFAALLDLVTGSARNPAGSTATTDPSPALSGQLAGAPQNDASPLGSLMDALAALETGSTEADAAPNLDRLEQALDAVLAMLSPTAPAAAAATAGSPAAPVPLAAQVVAESRAAAMPDAPATPEAAKPVLQPLADAIKAAAKTLDPQSPLAMKLAGLADSIEKGGLDAAALARLGLTSADDPDIARIEKAVATLLSSPAPAPAPTTPAAPAAPAASLFARPLLAPPPEAAASPRPAEATAPDADAPPAATPRPPAQPAQQPSPAASSTASSGDAPKPDAAANPPAPAPSDAAEPGAPPLPPAPPRADALAAAQRLAPAPYPSAAPIVPQVAFEIARQAQLGTSRFQIRLDPLDLGRIDVELSLDKTGAATARLTVERAETLDLLKRDQQSLEKALAQAGLDQSRTTLEFSLRQDNPSSRPDTRWTPPPLAASGAGEPGSDTAITTYRGVARPGGLDILA